MGLGFLQLLHCVTGRDNCEQMVDDNLNKQIKFFIKNEGKIEEACLIKAFDSSEFFYIPPVWFDD